jgi:hypothetical protein
MQFCCRYSSRLQRLYTKVRLYTLCNSAGNEAAGPQWLCTLPQQMQPGYTSSYSRSAYYKIEVYTLPRSAGNEAAGPQWLCTHQALHRHHCGSSSRCPAIAAPQQNNMLLAHCMSFKLYSDSWQLPALAVTEVPTHPAHNNAYGRPPQLSLYNMNQQTSAQPLWQPQCL